MVNPWNGWIIALPLNCELIHIQHVGFNECRASFDFFTVKKFNHVKNALIQEDKQICFCFRSFSLRKKYANYLFCTYTALGPKDIGARPGGAPITF